jgi:Mg/Co/Ni transporter MgtE
MPRDPSNSPGARALRLAGYVKLPAWWVTEEQLQLIEYMAKQNLAEINRIKDEAEKLDLIRGYDLE